MPQTRRSLMSAVVAAFASLALVVGAAVAAELLGTVKSVDVDAKKIVVTEKDTDKDIDVTVTDDTEWVSPKGKTIKSYDLAKLKKKSEVKIEHDGGKASKVTIEKAPAKKKDAN